MIRTWKTLTVLGLSTLVLSSSVALIAPAQAAGRGPLLASTVATSSEAVKITQQAPGSSRARLEWAATPNATEYRIYKTGSIRPSWRVFAVSSASATSRTVVDLPGAIAIYRVMAVVGSKEILVGRVTYIPTR
jgi:hypothetical protein